MKVKVTALVKTVLLSIANHKSKTTTLKDFVLDTDTLPMDDPILLRYEIEYRVKVQSLKGIREFIVMANSCEPNFTDIIEHDVGIVEFNVIKPE